MHILTAMVSKSSPKLKVIARGSPKFGRLLVPANVMKKKCSPKSSGVKKDPPKGMVCSMFHHVFHK